MFSAKNSGKPAALDPPRANGKAAVPSIISRHLAVRGDLDSDGDIQVDGSIEGDVKTTTLTIGESGSIKGAITAETVLVAGHVVGQIRAKTVSLSRTARVEGDIWHDSLAIEGGARFEGTCKRLSASGSEGGRSAWTAAAESARPADDDVMPIAAESRAH